MGMVCCMVTVCCILISVLKTRGRNLFQGSEIPSSGNTPKQKKNKKIHNGMLSLQQKQLNHVARPQKQEIICLFT